MGGVKRALAAAALIVFGGSAAQAARALGISEATIYRKLKAYRAAGADRL